MIFVLVFVSRQFEVCTNVSSEESIVSLRMGLIIIITIIRLEAKLRPNIAFTLRRVSAVFTRLATTRPKVNRFVCNLEQSENIVGGWPWQILGAICKVTTTGDPGEFFFVKASHKDVFTTNH